MGSKGRVSKAYAELMREMWVSEASWVAPHNVKTAIGDVAK